MASPGIKSLLVVLGLITTGCCQQFVVPNPISANQPFTVYCDASRVALPSGVNIVNKLQIFRNVSTDQSSNTAVAYYTVTAPPTISTSGSTIPPGRDWNFTFSGNNGTSGGIFNNRNTMKIEWTVRDTKCEDAGIYQCHVEYYPTGNNVDISSMNNIINVTATAGISDITLTVSPENINPSYRANDNLTFTCIAHGQNNLQISWRIGTWPPGSVTIQENNADTNAITNQPTSPPTAGSACAFYGYNSALNVQLTGNNDEEVYICVVADMSLRELNRKNITIGISPASVTQANTGPATAGPDVGMIVGIVIGCVLLIAIIIIIIIVVRYRKRKAEGDYKDDSDQADANRNTDLHAPPPVFYPSSKPSKGSKDDDKDIKISTTGMTNEALDNSYDSRDSGLKGPPRYINAEVDAQGPPRYEKETHRGRSNRGFDEEDRDRNGGHGRSHKQPRDGEERRHRSRNHDDGTHHRRYNPDDGTVSHLELGDPGMGTSI